MKNLSGAALTVQCLKQEKVRHILGVPGAKIDRVFNELLDGGPELIVCRHEQNAAFIAAAIGRLTGRPGVCLVTSGPGTSNLATGLITATTEGDPVVAIAGAVGRNEEAKRTHQSMQAVALMKPVTKYSVQAESAESIPEILSNAFRIASSPRKGAAFVGLPMDVQAETTTARPLVLPQGRSGAANGADIQKAAKRLASARLPVILVGVCAAEPAATAAIRKLLAVTPFPVVGTFQAAGVIPRELLPCFAGRVGLFRNQPGDILLAKADVILTIGYDPVEYDPHFWNPDNNAAIIHLSEVLAEIDNHYQPEIELLGNLVDSITLLGSYLKPKRMEDYPDALPIIKSFENNRQAQPKLSRNIIHPLHFIRTLRRLIGDDVTIACDMGSHYIWMVRNFLSFEPHRLLVSNGQQTLGVGLTWGIGACLVNPHEKVVSISGDGGFLFSAMELETAVRLKANLVHFVWKDGTYNMVAFQEQLKYGRVSGVNFGPVDTVKHAESYGAVGIRVNSPDELEAVMKKALETPGPVVVEIPIDYSENLEIGKTLHPDLFH
jgi:acetolactate synthase I/II/III large subunit